MNEHLKPDEREMLERAEKATKLKDNGHSAMCGCDDCTALWVQGHHYQEYAGVAMRTDLPTILARLANERAKLAIAMDALQAMGLGEFEDYELPRVARETFCRINALEKQS